MEYPALRTRTPITWSSASRLRTRTKPPMASSALTGISIDLPTTQVTRSTDASAMPPAINPLSWRFSMMAPEWVSPTPAIRMLAHQLLHDRDRGVTRIGNAEEQLVHRIVEVEEAA